MKRFYFLTDVKAASGWQRWYVDAETLDDAKAAHDRGEFEFDCEEVEIESLGDPVWDPDGELEE
jgi:hypothetical protein